MVGLTSWNWYLFNFWGFDSFAAEGELVTDCFRGEPLVWLGPFLGDAACFLGEPLDGDSTSWRPLEVGEVGADSLDGTDSLGRSKLSSSSRRSWPSSAALDASSLLFAETEKQKNKSWKRIFLENSFEIWNGEKHRILVYSRY
jgi:hypothetical protein